MYEERYKNEFWKCNKYRKERELYKYGINPLAWLMRSWLYLIHNLYIPGSYEIGEGNVFSYKGIGCVIHGRTIIDKNCKIGTDVTIGARLGYYDVPVIGDNVDIAIEVKILGHIHIGNNFVIGASSSNT